MDIISFVDSLQPNIESIKGDLRKIADVHIAFYKFYIRFASRCDAWVFDKKSRVYLESCVDFLENKKLTSKSIQQSRNNCLKMLDSLNDLCVSLGADRRVLSTLHELIDKGVVDEAESKKGNGTLDLLKQLKNLLNDPIESDDSRSGEPMETGRISPANSEDSCGPENEMSKSRGGGVEPMMQYLLSDSGMDGYYPKYSREIRNVALTCKMNSVMSKASGLRENRYTGLDNIIAKMKVNVPMWNYNLDRVDTIDSNNVMENMDIFRGNQSVTDAVLYSCPELLSIGPFDVYLRNKVFVYHCMVNKCNDCMTTSLEFLKLHVKFNHGDANVDWNCTSCDLIKLHSSCQRSLDGALDHLAKYHSSKSTYTLSKERLMEINRRIVEDDASSICPVISGEIQTEDNIDLFHCPVVECEFSTNSPSIAFGHFASVADAIALKCRYCPLVTYSTYELCEHLVKIHGNANYKCGYCPYRTISKTNAAFHQRDFHPDMEKKIFGIEPLMNVEHKYDCRAQSTIRPFVCREECAFQTFVEKYFNNHLLNHPGVSIACSYCKLFATDDIGDLRDHLLIHGVGEYLCLYCKEAFNFISRVERHLHEAHPSQFPFVVICQDFDSRSISLDGKYSKFQKLDIGEESIVVLPLEGDRSVSCVEIISKCDAVTIDDVDHCKMQMKVFLKNKEEPKEAVMDTPVPTLEETLDLTEDEQRADIKPRLRVRTIEELMTGSSQQAGDIIESASGRVTAGESEQVFLPLEGPVCSVSDSNCVMPPVNIKKEVLSTFGTSEIDIDDIQVTGIVLSSRIKKEVNEVNKAPQKKVATLNVAIKQETVTEQDDNEVQTVGNLWERNEDNEAADLISRQGLNQENCGGSDLTAMAPQLGSVKSTHEDGASSSLAGTWITLPTGEKAIIVNTMALSKEEVTSGHSNFDFTEPSTSAAGTGNAEVDDSQVDDKSLVLDKPVRPLYKEPTIIDTVIISDGEGDCDGSSSVDADESSGNCEVAQRTLESPASLPSTSLPSADTKKYRCKLCNFTSTIRQVTYQHLYKEHPESFKAKHNKTTRGADTDGELLVSAVSCPYCPEKVYEGIKSFERHHGVVHGDFSEMKCFLVFSSKCKQSPQQIFACNFCGFFCLNEEAVWEHTHSSHEARLKNSKRPLNLKSIVALKKMVCPLYNCLDEFLDPVAFKDHVDSHETVIACKTCTYIADTEEAFQTFHDELDPVERLTHFFYRKSKEDRHNLVKVQRFTNPLYSLNKVIFKEKLALPAAKKTTARKSTGGAQFNR